MEHNKSRAVRGKSEAPASKHGHLRVLDGGKGARVAAVIGAEHDAPPMGALRVEPSAVAAPSLRRHALLPLAMMICAGVYYGASWSLSAVLGLACALMLLQSWIGPWIRTSRERLDRDLLTLIAKGRKAELAPRLAAAWGFRLFGAPGEIQERRGRVLAEVGDVVGAQRAYASALEGYANAAPLGVLSGLANAAYRAGDDTMSIEALRAALDSAPHLGEIRLQLAHAIVRSNGRLADAEALYGEGANERTLLRVAAALQGSDPARARKLLASAAASPGGWLRQVLEAELDAKVMDAEVSKRPKAR